MKIAEIEETGKLITNEYLQEKSITSIIRSKTLDNSTRIQIVDGDGNVIYPNDWMGIFYSTSYNKKIINNILAGIPKVEGASDLYDLKIYDDDYQSFIYASYLGEERGSDLYLMIVSMVEPIDSTVLIMRRQFPYIIGIVFVLGMIVSYFVSQKLSEPILELNEIAKELATGKYDINFPTSGVYEVDELSKTLNYATKELSKMDEMRVSIVANVSHDLKTPLTVIKSYSEMIKDISGENKEMRDNHLDIIISEADRLTEMVNSILDISKLEMQMDDLKMEELSLRELTENLIYRLDILRTRQNYEFIIEGNSEGVINGDRSMMNQVLYLS
ncbi:MAG: HAMP domain-containing sensor histidine kinase, partial [Neofamilia sp.]